MRTQLPIMRRHVDASRKQWSETQLVSKYSFNPNPNMVHQRVPCVAALANCWNTKANERLIDDPNKLPFIVSPVMSPSTSPVTSPRRPLGFTSSSKVPRSKSPFRIFSPCSDMDDLERIRNEMKATLASSLVWKLQNQQRRKIIDLISEDECDDDCLCESNVKRKSAEKKVHFQENDDVLNTNGTESDNQIVVEGETPMDNEKADNVRLSSDVHNEPLPSNQKNPVNKKQDRVSEKLSFRVHYKDEYTTVEEDAGEACTVQGRRYPVNFCDLDKTNQIMGWLRDVDKSAQKSLLHAKVIDDSIKHTLLIRTTDSK